MMDYSRTNLLLCSSFLGSLHFNDAAAHEDAENLSATHLSYLFQKWRQLFDKVSDGI